MRNVLGLSKKSNKGKFDNFETALFVPFAARSAA
jgi:hypothetical protein